MKVLVSACLLGDKVRHDGRDKFCDLEILRRWVSEGRVVTVCPELAGGLPVPRLPSEIENGAGGDAVLAGGARVIDIEGGDVTRNFVAGADAALAAAATADVCVAILKEGSPSCGTSFIYDGSFRGVRVTAMGVTAARLAAAGVRVFGETQLPEADAYLRGLERTAAGPSPSR